MSILGNFLGITVDISTKDGVVKSGGLLWFLQFLSVLFLIYEENRTFKSKLFIFCAERAWER
jgi:hypothetical protein